MRAFVVTGPERAEVLEVDPPVAEPGEVVVDVALAGVCGTDMEFFTGHMEYLHNGGERYPVRIGHEWCGTVTAVGPGVDPGWLGRRVTGDTMLGCRRCHRCASGRHHVCADRTEIGIRGGRPGALAEQLAVPAVALHALPDTVDDVAGAMVEPGGNAWRVADAALAGPGRRLLVVGPGTIGLLVALMARAAGAEVHVVGETPASVGFAATLGLAGVWTWDSLPDLPFDAVADASTGPAVPARAAGLVEPGGRVVLIGLSPTPSLLDTRGLVLSDVTAVGVLSASPGLPGAIGRYGAGEVDPRPLVAATVGLSGVADVLAGHRPAGAGPGPKVLVDPRRP